MISFTLLKHKDIKGRVCVCVCECVIERERERGKEIQADTQKKIACVSE
jgi:hypothetical protein